MRGSDFAVYMLQSLLSPALRESGDIKTHPSVCLSVCHKTFNLGHNVCSGRAFKFDL